MNPAHASPRWSTTTKLFVALVALLLVVFLLSRFSVLISPLVMSVIVAYLLNPLVQWMVGHLRLPRGISVGLVFFVLALLLLGLLGGAGFLIQQQLVGFLSAIQVFLDQLPRWVGAAVASPVAIGPIHLDFSVFSLSVVQSQLVSSARDLVAQVARLLTMAASSVIRNILLAGFALAVSFYLLNDLYQVETSLLRLVPPAYRRDADRVFRDLGPLWNAFLRGQAILSLTMIVAYAIVMSALGLRYSMVIAIAAGLAEFVPILGPLANGLTAVLIGVFQPSNWFGLSSLAYGAVIALAAIILQQLEAYVLVPRIIAYHLRLHPALVIVGALVGASLGGIPGLLLAAPILATLRRIGGYLYAKMFDLPPWPLADDDLVGPPARFPTPAAETTLPIADPSPEREP
ncbi:MAG: AI-2E family transporter [Anaerolineales bacterium]|jgi:predicted PurR-regulated permease PerM